MTTLSTLSVNLTSTDLPLSPVTDLTIDITTINDTFNYAINYTQIGFLTLAVLSTTTSVPIPAKIFFASSFSSSDITLTIVNNLSTLTLTSVNGAINSTSTSSPYGSSNPFVVTSAGGYSIINNDITITGNASYNDTVIPFTSYQSFKITFTVNNVDYSINFVQETQTTNISSEAADVSSYIYTPISSPASTNAVPLYSLSSLSIPGPTTIKGKTVFDFLGNNDANQFINEFYSNTRSYDKLSIFSRGNDYLTKLENKISYLNFIDSSLGGLKTNFITSMIGGAIMVNKLISNPSLDQQLGFSLMEYNYYNRNVINDILLNSNSYAISLLKSEIFSDFIGNMLYRIFNQSSNDYYINFWNTIYNVLTPQFTVTVAQLNQLSIYGCKSIPLCFQKPLDQLTAILNSEVDLINLLLLRVSPLPLSSCEFFEDITLVYTKFSRPDIQARIVDIVSYRNPI